MRLPNIYIQASKYAVNYVNDHDTFREIEKRKNYFNDSQNLKIN